MTTDLEHICNVAANVAEAASAIPMSYFRAPLKIVDKDDESPVTIADQETETFIREALSEAFPGHGIFGEEFGITGSMEGQTWIIDPIDGTRSFVSGSPLFGMLMGYLVGGVPQAGLVRMPALNETFIGAKGRGATLNGKAIQCRPTTDLTKALVFVNEAERLQQMDSSLFTRLCRIGHVRRMNYDCYPHAMVAGGMIDAVIDMGLFPYDFLPLVGLVEAAGGVITDWKGEALTLGSEGHVVTAATPALHAQVLDYLHSSS